MNSNIIKLLQSDDYKERLYGEYLEVLERAEKLRVMIYKYDRGLLDLTPDTPIKILKAQLNTMESYLNILDYRINIEYPELWSSD